MSVSIIRNSFNVSRMIMRNKSIFSNSLRNTLFSVEQIANSRTISRSLFHLSRKREPFQQRKLPLSFNCSCGCKVHTKGDQELMAFLVDEIQNERKTHQKFDLNRLDDFQCSFNGAEVILMKKNDNETIKITAIVSDSVDAEDSIVDPNEAKQQQQDDVVMEAKPEFTVEVTKNQKTLSFHCNFTQEVAEEEREGENYNDVFQIADVSFHEGEFTDNTYTVSGEIIDGYLYDLLMNYLEERGVSNEFAEKMIGLFTHHEHKLYIQLLERMKNFVEK